MTEEKHDKKLESDVIWAEIKDLPIEMFALPGQKVSDHVKPIKIPGSKLYVKLGSTAVITSLEYAIGGKYNVLLGDKYTTIERKDVAPADEVELAEVEMKARKLRAKLNK